MQNRAVGEAGQDDRDDEYEEVQNSDQSQDYFSAEDEDELFEEALEQLENSQPPDRHPSEDDSGRAD